MNVRPVRAFAGLLAAWASVGAAPVPHAGWLAFDSVTASRSDAGKGPERAVDGDPSTNWAAPAPASLVFRLAPSTEPPARWRIRFTRGTERRYSHVLESSPDGHAWVAAAAGDSPLAAEPHVVDVAPRPDRWWRLRVLGNSESPYANVEEVEAFAAWPPAGTGLESWRAARFGIAAPSAPDAPDEWATRRGDGATPPGERVPNLVAYALGLPPGGVPPLAWEISPDGSRLRLRLASSGPVPGDVRVTLETGTGVPGRAWTATPSVVGSDGIVADPGPVSAAFGRVAVRRDWLRLVQDHFDRFLEIAPDRVGPRSTALWVSSLDVRTGQRLGGARPRNIPSRVYRSIAAPDGATLYWDQPKLVAAHALSVLTGDPRYAAAADAAVRDFLDLCVASNGIFLWGNHYYYDVVADGVRRFVSEETPRLVDPAEDPGDYHEARPIPPAWGLFLRVDPEATERAIRASTARHVVDAATGEFDRHAGGLRGYPFLESGGILVHSLAWLHARTDDPMLLDTADRLVAYAAGGRGASGLVRNQRVVDRWDRHVSTTEVGLWAASLAHAADLVPGGRGSAWRAAGDAAVAAWLERGWDPARRRYFGRLAVDSGQPDLSPRTTPYQPPVHASLWDPLFPTHDYPMAIAEHALRLFRETGDEPWAEAVRRWIAVVAAELPARGGLGAHAEQYARVIHFLVGASEAGFSSATPLAAMAIDEALRVLHVGPLFRGHAGEDRLDAVDGVGYLLLVLLRLESGAMPDLMGLHW